MKIHSSHPSYQRHLAQTPSDQFSLQTTIIPEEPLHYIRNERKKRQTTSNSFRFIPHLGPVERETPYPMDVLRRDRVMKESLYRAQDHV